MRPIEITVTAANGNSGRTIPLDIMSDEVAMQFTVTGTVNYTIKQTLDDPYSAVAPTWVDHPDANLVGATATKQGNYDFVPRAVQVVINSGAGSVKAVISQPLPGL